MAIDERLAREARAAAELTCAFCDRPQSALRTLIMGPTVGICDDCTAPATTVVRDGVPAQDIRTSMSPSHEGRTCSFCGKEAGPALPMARADSGAVAICADCVDLCHEVLVEPG